MKNTIKLLIPSLIILSVLLVTVVPVVSSAQNNNSNIVKEVEEKGLVPCGTQENKTPCGFSHFIKLINNVISFILFGLALPIAAIMFAYAGFLLVTAGEESAHARTEAKTIFKNAVIGIVLAAGAWLIVKTLLSILGYKDIGLFF